MSGKARENLVMHTDPLHPFLVLHFLTLGFPVVHNKVLLDVYGLGLSIAQLHLKILEPHCQPPLHWCLMRAVLSVHPTSRQQHLMSRAVRPRPLLFTPLPPPLRRLTTITKSMMAMTTTIARTKLCLPSHLLPLMTPLLRLPPLFPYLVRKKLPKLATGFGLAIKVKQRNGLATVQVPLR